MLYESVTFKNEVVSVCVHFGSQDFDGLFPYEPTLLEHFSNKDMFDEVLSVAGSMRRSKRQSLWVVELFQKRVVRVVHRASMPLNAASPIDFESDPRDC